MKLAAKILVCVIGLALYIVGCTMLSSHTHDFGLAAWLCFMGGIFWGIGWGLFVKLLQVQL